MSVNKRLAQEIIFDIFMGLICLSVGLFIGGILVLIWAGMSDAIFKIWFTSFTFFIVGLIGGSIFE